MDYEKTTASNKPTNPSPTKPINKLGIFQKLSSIWPFRSSSSKPSLREYLDFNEKIKLQLTLNNKHNGNFKALLKDSQGPKPKGTNLELFTEFKKDS